MSALPLLIVLLAALPDGWREPRPLKDNSCAKETSYEVHGDLDGDGIEDTARLLARKDRQMLALFVWLGTQPPMLIESFGVYDDGLHRLSIGLQPGGFTFPTWCGRAEYCEEGQPAWVKLEHPTVALITCEASMSYLQWRPKTKKFRWVLMSD
ncbi:MAG: hypothetical protein JNM17_18150 [Archangium sp.]|nr:hypothetical protein [Archangium sp.]